MVGLILAVMSLITVLSVMNGFHEELTNRVLNAISHSYITENDNTLENWEELSEEINSQDQILALDCKMSFDNNALLDEIKFQNLEINLKKTLTKYMLLIEVLII